MHGDAGPATRHALPDDDPLFPTKDALIDMAKRFPGATKRYIGELFPVISWIPHYNLRWALGDAIAGLTIGMMVINCIEMFELMGTMLIG